MNEQHVIASAAKLSDWLAAAQSLIVQRFPAYGQSLEAGPLKARLRYRWVRWPFLLLIAWSHLAFAETVFPGLDWERETNVLSPETVRGVDALLHTLDTTALMVVKDGRVIYEYGDVTRLSYLASTRKSVLSMLYGPYIADGKIRLEATLKDLEMSDVGGLLPIEERAKVTDLITARSGVYHPAAYPGDLLSIAPKRGSKEPGTYWLYSNWDFDAAGAVFERMTGKNIFDALRDDLAIPIGMQDFDRKRQQKSGDLTRSQYPAYVMVLSTRDMARLGCLMLRQGKWRDRQIIPAEWVSRSTSVRTPLEELQPAEARAGPLGYGYLWWVWDGPFATGPYKGAYSACGAHGQYITVLPALDMVVAHKTWPTGDVSQSEYLRLLDLLTGKQPASTAELAVWEHAPVVYDSYVGQYRISRGLMLGTQVILELLKANKSTTSIIAAASCLIALLLLRKANFRKRCLIIASAVTVLGLFFCLGALALSHLVKPVPSLLGIGREASRLYVSGSRQAKTGEVDFNIKLQPTSEGSFLINGTGLPVTFYRDGHGKVSGLMAKTDGKHEVSFEKFSDKPPASRPVPKPRISIKLDPRIYDAYAGQYDLPGKTSLTIKRDGDALICQIAGRFPEEVFPESETAFFETMENEQLIFVKNESGEVTGVIINEDGYPSQTGKKVNTAKN